MDTSQKGSHCPAHRHAKVIDHKNEKVNGTSDTLVESHKLNQSSIELQSNNKKQLNISPNHRKENLTATTDVHLHSKIKPPSKGKSRSKIESHKHYKKNT